MSLAATIFRGCDKAIASVKRMRAEYPDLFARALYQQGQVILKVIKSVTPYEFGVLRASIAMTEPQRSGRRIWIEVSASAPYAFFVHEDLEAEHAPGTYARYIARPIEEAMPTLSADIAKRINEGTGQGKGDTASVSD